jgi:hypothetical protein
MLIDGTGGPQPAFQGIRGTRGAADRYQGTETIDPSLKFDLRLAAGITGLSFVRLRVAQAEPNGLKSNHIG